MKNMIQLIKAHWCLMKWSILMGWYQATAERAELLAPEKALAYWAKMEIYDQLTNELIDEMVKW